MVGGADGRLSYVLAAAVPLLPYFFFVGTRALFASMVMTGRRCTVGVAKARLTQRPELRAGMETMATGLVGTGICWGSGAAWRTSAAARQ